MNSVGKHDADLGQPGHGIPALVAPPEVDDAGDEDDEERQVGSEASDTWRRRKMRWTWPMTRSVGAYTKIAYRATSMVSPVERRGVTQPPGRRSEHEYRRRGVAVACRGGSASRDAVPRRGWPSALSSLDSPTPRGRDRRVSLLLNYSRNPEYIVGVADPHDVLHALLLFQERLEQQHRRAKEQRAQAGQAPTTARETGVGRAGEQVVGRACPAISKGTSSGSSAAGAGRRAARVCAASAANSVPGRAEAAASPGTPSAASGDSSGASNTPAKPGAPRTPSTALIITDGATTFAR